MADILDAVADALTPSVFKKGKKKEDAVTIRIGTEYLETWESVDIERSIDNLCAGFGISIADKWRHEGKKWVFVPGERVEINIGDTPMINGYIDRLDVSVSNEDRTLSINGRDKTGDLVDCSAASGVNEFRNFTIDKLARYFAGLFGINVVVDADVGAAFKLWTIKQGETVFETLQRAALLRSLLLLSNEKGDLVITNRAGAQITAPPSAANLVKEFDFVGAAAMVPQLKNPTSDLIQGENVLTASASYDNADRHSDYIVKGQRPGLDDDFGTTANTVTATAKDYGVKRFRPTLVLAEGNVDIAAAQKRANWESTVRAAKALDIVVTVQGWRKGNKDLWRANELVRAEIPYVGINSQMLVQSVRYSRSQSGTLTTMKLTRPDAYNPKDELKAEDDPAKKDDLGWASNDNAAGDLINLAKSLV